MLLRITILFLISIVLQVSAEPVKKIKPQRIASINLCTDQYLLLLSDPENIVTVTWLSKKPRSSYYYDRAIDIPVNHGEAEEIIAHNPDLVLAGFYSARATSRLLQQLGYKVEIFKHPISIDQIRDQIRRVAKLIGQQHRAELVIKKMNQRLQSVVTQPTTTAPTLMQYAPGGYTVGRKSLVGDIIYKSGWHNKATDAGIHDRGIIDLETLLLTAPQVLIDSPLAPDSFSFAEQMLKHPVLKKTLLPQTTVSIDRKLWICGGPMVVDALIALRDARINFEKSFNKINTKKVAP